MVGTRLVSRVLALCVLGLAIIATPAFAQTGQIKGKVVDAENKPVEGAKVTLLAKDTNGKFDLKTNKKGEFMQIGVPPGDYDVKVEKDGLTTSKRQHIGLDMAELTLTLKKGGDMADVSKEDRAKAEAKVASIKTAYAEAAALANAGKYDEAVVKFNEVIASCRSAPSATRASARRAARRRTTPRPRRRTRRRSRSIRTTSTRTTGSRRSTTIRRSSPKRRR